MKYSELLQNMKSCPFCGDVGYKSILETDTAFLTYAEAPYYQDHLLVCPKRHVEHLYDLHDDEHRDIESLQQKGFEILEKLGHKNITFMVREGRDTGKSVDHVHYHLIPEIALGNEDHAGLERMVLSTEDKAELTERLKSVL